MDKQTRIKGIERIINKVSRIDVGGKSTQYCELKNVRELATAIEESIRVDEENVLMYSAQGYCTERNKEKVLDPDLLQDIAKTISENRDVIKIGGREYE